MTKDVSENRTFVTLPGRGLIRIAGPDRRAFLDALVSNDLTLLDRQPSLYACLLTPQGKFLYDFIIHEDVETLILDCEGGERLAGLLKKLNLYKLRSKIAMELSDPVPVYASAHRVPGGVPDPRHPGLGFRTLTRPSAMDERPFAEWDSLRLSLCVPDGSRDMVPEQSTLIECNVDALHGISYEKGCYVGQELTARMHHRGLAKKHLCVTQWHETPPAPGEDIHINGTLIGQMRSSCGDLGLALLKDEALQTLATHPSLPFILLGAAAARFQAGRSQD